MHGRLFLDNMHRVLRYTRPGVDDNNKRAPRSSRLTELAPKLPPPAGVSHLRPCVPAPARIARFSSPGELWGDPGATRAGLAGVTRKLPASPAMWGRGSCSPGGQWPRVGHRTCHIEDRREHDIDEEGATHRQQSRPEAATTGLSFQLTLHILPSSDATVL